MTEKQFKIYIEKQTLYDDESVREKLTVMNKWDAIHDDARNECDPEDIQAMEDFLQLGGTYDIEITITETRGAVRHQPTGSDERVEPPIVTFPSGPPPIPVDTTPDNEHTKRSNI